MAMTKKTHAPKLIHGGRKLSNSSTKPFQIMISMVRMSTQETLSENHQDMLYLDRIDMNDFSRVTVDLKPPQQEVTEYYHSYF